MSKKKIIILVIIIILAIFATIFFIHTITPSNRKIVLWTDNPEFISYVELFNSEHENLKIETVYKNDPARALIKTKKYPDIIVASYLNSPQSIDSFVTVNHLFRKNKIAKTAFYKDLLSKGAKGTKQSLLPVSFNMPAIMFRKGAVSDTISSFMLTYENITEISKTFNGNTKQGVLAFSPRWNSDLLYYNAVMDNADFRSGADGKTIIYNGDAVERSIDRNRLFIRDVNGGLENDKQFEEKHLYKPAENLIIEQRIFFAYTDLRDFYSIPQQKRENLNFRWLARDNKIAVSDNVIFAGIPRQGKNKKAAEAFLIWFFDYNNQERILEETRTKRVRSFGIAGGFSSIRAVNEQFFPRHYPLLIGHIPPQELLHFPPALPPEWEYIKNDVILRWLYREAGNEKTSSSLDAAINDWYKFHPGF